MEFKRSQTAKRALGIGNPILEAIPDQINELIELGFISKTFINTSDTIEYFGGKCYQLYKRRKVAIYFIDRADDHELIACIYYDAFQKSESLAENIILWLQNNIQILNA